MTRRSSGAGRGVHRAILADDDGLLLPARAHRATGRGPGVSAQPGRRTRRAGPARAAAERHHRRRHVPPLPAGLLHDPGAGVAGVALDRQLR